MLEPRPSVRVALVGVGNCASSLVQGLAFYQHGANDLAGLLHEEIGGMRPSDVHVVAAWDVDQRKVGRDVADAIFAKPNCTAVFCPEVEPCGATVRMGRVADGVAAHMLEHSDKQRSFVLAAEPEPDREEIVAHLREARVDVMLNYLPVGSQAATEFYAQCALDAGVAFVNNIPVFIASDPVWAERFAAAGVPIIGDDIKAQIGATIVHRALTDLFRRRGATLDRTYQLNIGGNTDFLNMSSRQRLASKKISKTEAVQSVAQQRLGDDDIHIGPSDYVAWQNDNKVCFLRMEGRIFGGVPINLEMRLSVEDSPNSAGVAIDMVRCAKLAADHGIGGVIDSASAFFCKHPPRQMTDDAASDALERFIMDPQNG
ncbi:Inositol-3-phosphate synthase [Beijerinckiaceae bacterium RH AL1]|nr:inositol-3-phosphate synthase [Beijerinckiaceae bacterium]VVB48214.1 Inositol-3-phosphate synthase [Beijerinckiaceae bacterium RH CH11]VVB48294.1 Inositol-3-phosphate synthase [Beijerinckiaceae bacterium RH AL8]VVC56281.1 Inositol-3-phosphate synthase [Beijerinckiaceae bacterium RH AL1]